MTKNRYRKIAYALLLLSILAVLSSAVLTVYAQEVTKEAAPAATADPTAAAGVNVNINTQKQDEAPAPGGVPWDVISVIVVSLAGAYTLPRIIDSIRKDPNAIASIETRVEALPEPLVSTGHRAAEILESAARLLIEATDGIKAASKPPEAFDLKTVSEPAFDTEAVRRGYRSIYTQ